jgi:hypothetical protein
MRRRKGEGDKSKLFCNIARNYTNFAVKQDYKYEKGNSLFIIDNNAITYWVQRKHPKYQLPRKS